MNKAIGISVKLLLTIVACAAMWQASELTEFLANMPNDIAVMGSAVVISVATIMFVFVMYVIWGNELKKLKGLKAWLDS